MILDLTTGEGGIEPAARVASGEITQEQIMALAERLQTDEFDAALADTIVPNVCVDGRSQADGGQVIGPNAAGGTWTLVAADALTNGRYRDEAKAPVHAKRLYSALKDLGQAIGAHDDDHAAGDNCGCGAEDKFDNPDPSSQSILGYITRRGDELVGIVRSLGIDVSDELMTAIMTQAAVLRKQSYATNGADLREAARELGGDNAIATLTGTHNEVIARINTKPGMTLDRKKVVAQFGDKYQAFNVDVPAIKYGTQLIAADAEDAHAKFVAALVYNLATASVLAGPSLLVVVK